MIRTFEPTPVVKPARHDKPEMTLDRALSRAGVASRTAAAALIAAGRVQVAGRVVRDPQAWVAPARQAILLDGKRLRQPRPEYYALHKPVGYITSHGDPQGRPTIYDLLPADEGWLFSVGRLDQDTSGLLLVTNDSVFAERVANPRSHVAKTYHVRVEAALAEAELGQLQCGLDIGRGERSGPARAARCARPAGRGGCAALPAGKIGATAGRLTSGTRGAAAQGPAPTDEHWIELEIHEGKNRQVRRMVEALGHQVLALVRVRIGKLELGRLASGKLRAISPGDVLGQ